MRAALACALLLLPSPALADGPALAHLTIAGQTITLTQVAPGEGLVFAQMHLGFPLPPVLHVTLTEETALIGLNAAQGTSDGAGTPLGPEVYLWFDPAPVITNADALSIEVQAQTRSALGQFTAQPVRIDIQFTSP